MNPSKLFELISSISGQERADLRVFIGMSGNALNEELQAVFLLLLDYMEGKEEISEEDFKVEMLSAAQAKKWNRTKNHLLRVLKKFMLMKLTDTEGVWESFVLTKYYLDHKLKKNFDSTLKKTLKTIQQRRGVAEEDVLEYFLYLLEIQNKKDVRVHDTSVQLSELALDRFYLTQRLRILCERYNRFFMTPGEDAEAIEKEVAEIRGKIEVWEAIQNSKNDFILAKLYLNVIDISSTSSEEAYENMLKFIADEDHEKHIPKAIWVDVHKYLMNYCIRKIHQCDFDYIDGYFHFAELSGYGRTAALEQAATLEINIFVNHVSMAILAEDYEWAEKLIAAVAEVQNSRDWKNIMVLAKALLLFYRGQTEESHEALQQFDTQKDTFYKLIYKSLLMKIYFTQKSWLVLKDYIISFRKYVKEQKIGADREQKMLNFIQCVGQLYRAKVKKEEKEIDLAVLKGEIFSLDYLWLIKLKEKEQR